MTDAELAIAALHRALEANLQENPHAPIHLGAAGEFAGKHVQTVSMMKPCRCGAPMATAYFLGSTPEEAIRAARHFVAALVKDEEEA